MVNSEIFKQLIQLSIKKTLQGVVDGIKFQVGDNKENVGVLRKYYWFQDYHNRKVRQLESEGLLDSCEELIIELPKYLTPEIEK